MEIKKSSLKQIRAALNSTMPEGVQVENKNREKLAEAFHKKANLTYDVAYQMSRTPLFWQDPLYDSSLQMFPLDDLEERNKRLRHFYKFNPILGNVVDAHSTFPLSDFEIMVDNQEVKDYYTYISDNLSLLEVFECELRDTTLLGESVFLGNWDDTNMEWEEWIQYPPEYVEITTIPGSSKRVFTIKPDPEITKILKNNNEASQILSDVLKKVNNKYFEAASKGNEYEIPETRLMYISNKAEGYSKRGYPLTLRALPDLLYEMQLRTLQHTFVQRHMFPIKVFKLGSKELGWIPSQKHFQQFKKLLIQAAADPDFNLIYHFGLEVEYIGTKDKIENLIPHFEFCTKRIMNAFFMNDALLNGEAPSYAGQTSNMRLLMHRFMTKRKALELEARRKIYLPIARMQGLIKQNQGESQKLTLVKSKKFAESNYYLPEFLWQKQNLINNSQTEQMAMSLYDQGSLPFGIIRDMLGLDQKVIDNYRKQEQGSYSNRMTREIVDELIKEDPSLALDFAIGEDPIKILKNKILRNKKVEEQEEMKSRTGDDFGPSTPDDMDSGFDSSAPIDISDTSDTGESAGEENPATDIEEPAPSEGNESTESLPNE